jgi:acetoin utilization protein AcuB
MLVENCMSRPAVTVREDTDYQNALALMQRQKLRRLPVVDDQQRLVGIVVERDLLLAAMHYVPAHIEVAEVMTRNVITATPRMPLGAVATRMLDNKISGLPVVEDGELVGIITESDIFKRFVQLES